MPLTRLVRFSLPWLPRARPPFPQPLAQFLELATRRLQLLFQPLLLALPPCHACGGNSVPAGATPIPRGVAPPAACGTPPCSHWCAARTLPHLIFSTPFRLCPAILHPYTEYLLPWWQMSSRSQGVSASSVSVRNTAYGSVGTLRACNSHTSGCSRNCSATCRNASNTAARGPRWTTNRSTSLAACACPRATEP